jgi:PAS domain S-box-containing protein
MGNAETLDNSQKGQAVGMMLQGSPLRKSWRRIASLAAVIAIPVILGFGLLLAFSTHRESELRDRIVANEARRNVGILKELIESRLRTAFSDLLFLASLPALDAYVENEASGRRRQQLEQVFYNFIREKGTYDQARFLDTRGRETVRVNYNEGLPVAVPPGDLQDKSAQSYVQGSLGVGLNGLHVSRLELNMEGGAIEEPLKPVVRVGTPVYDDQARKKGIVVLNMLAGPLLEELDRATTPWRMFLVDEAGYWLKGPAAEDEWGFLFQERRDRRFGSAFPQGWAAVSENEAGVAWTARGVFAFEEIYPLRLGESVGISPEKMGSSSSESLGGERHWTIVAYVPEELVGLGRRELLVSAGMLFGAIVVLVGVLAVALANSAEKRRLARRELARSEARIKAIVESAVDCIITVDGKGDIQSSNRAVTAIFGYDAEELIGRNVATLIRESSGGILEGDVCRVLDTGISEEQGKRSREVTGVRKNGDAFPLDLAVSEVKTEGDVLFTGILRDITLEKQAKQALKEGKKAAEQANQMKTDFLNVVSHELRTPLSVILGNTPLLMNPKNLPDAEEISEIAKEMEEDGRHLLTLINDLLDISKIEAGRMDLHREMVSAAGIIADAVASLRVLAEGKGLALDMDAEEVAVWADPVRLKQILLNLLGNAVKFTEQGGITVKVFAEAGSAVFQVRDTGIGMRSEDIPLIFQAFRQVGEPGEQRAAGSGLGLAITKNLVEMHGGGSLDVESEVGVGSVFSFTIPLAKRS